MVRVFFSYASEDADVVDAVYHAFAEAYPQYKPWLDKYQIVAGDSLLTKIAHGMDEADKFFIFLSPISVNKPWVQRELRRAIMREISGVDPQFIVPIKLGELDRLPAFLEDKLYIDLGRLTREDWLAQFDAAIQGEVYASNGSGSGNVQVSIEYSPVGRHIARVVFRARAWAEQFSFAVIARADITNAYIEGEGAFTGVAEVREPRLFALRFDTPELRPSRPLVLRVDFAPGVDAAKAIEQVLPWRPPAFG